MSLEKNRLDELLSINPLLFDYYLGETLTNEEKSEVIRQLENNEQFLF